MRTGKINFRVKRWGLAVMIAAAACTIQPAVLYSQQQTESQRKLKKTKKKRMKDSRIAEKSAKKRHLSIQTKDTRKRMKKHLKKTKKHIEDHQHRR